MTILIIFLVVAAGVAYLITKNKIHVDSIENVTKTVVDKIEPMVEEAKEVVEKAEKLAPKNETVKKAAKAVKTADQAVKTKKSK